MAERTRNRDNDRDRRSDTDRADHDRRDRRSDTDRGYDETVHNGPPLDTSVARGDYRPGEDSLAGAGVRGYGGPDASEPWGHGADPEHPRTFVHGSSGDDAPPSGLPAGFGSADGGYGRLGGWRHGGETVQRRAGPKGYTRSDDLICEDVCEHLMNLDDIDASDVEVRVHGGCVVLEGTVPERPMKYAIEDIAAQTLGVKDVENNIRVPRRNAD